MVIGANPEDAARLRELYDLHSDTNAAWGGTYDADLYARFDELRASGPVHEGAVAELVGGEAVATIATSRGGPVYSCFSFDTVDAVFRDNATYSSNVYDTTAMLFGKNILNMGGTEHRRYRALVQPSFTTKAAQWWIDRWIAPNADALISMFEGEGRADLNLQFCALLPLLITAGSFGIDSGDALSYRDLVDRMIRPASAGGGQMDAARELGDRLAPIIAARKTEPEDDLISVLTQAELVDEDGQRHRLSDDDILGFSRLLLAAGTGTTWRQLGITLFALLRDPIQLEAVRSDPMALRAAIEESVRWEVTDPVFHRRTTRDVTLAGVDIPAGAVIELCIGAANRDPSRWDDPHTFDLRRPMLPHTGFAGGPHVCLGMHVARAEMTVAVTSLLDRLPNLRIDPDAEPPRIVGLDHRGVSALPVVFG